MTPPSSWRLSGLRRALAIDGHQVLERFWAEVTRSGAPLVEPLDADAKHALLTFLWRSPDADNVCLLGGPGGWRLDPLERLGDTDLWFRSYKVPADTRCTYLLVENAPLRRQDPNGEVAGIMQALVRRRVDPLNPNRTRVFPEDEPCPMPGEEFVSVVELPGAPPQPWAERRDGAAAGRLDEHRLVSAVLGNERRVWVHTIHGYDEAVSGGEHGLVVLFDGNLLRSNLVGLPIMLDNMAAAGALPPVVTVMVDNPDPPTRMRELACFPPFVDFLADELIPFVRERYRVTRDPSRVVVGGGSHGGLMAAFAAVRRPDRFSSFLSTSGSFWWNPEGDAEPEWLAREVASATAVPSRCVVNAGRFETGVAPNGGPDALTCSRHMRNVLAAKGSDVHYSEFSGGHDIICWRTTLPEGLIALTRGW